MIYIPWTKCQVESDFLIYFYNKVGNNSKSEKGVEIV